MAEAAIIQWTPSNWITVVLMVAIAFFLLGAFARFMQQRKAQQTAS